MSSAVAELRALAPCRATRRWEARILAERQANKLLVLSQVASLPVPEQLIECLPRLDVVYRRSQSLSGACRWTGTRWMIVVNANDTWGRQRFSLAHEFKHIIDAPLEKVLYRDQAYVPAEIQREHAADYFAACLLMPRTLLKRAYFEGGIRDERALARLAQVTAAAMRRRLTELQLAGTTPQVAA